MPPQPPEISVRNIVAQKALQGEQFGSALPPQFEWMNNAIKTVDKNPADFRKPLKTGTEIGDRSQTVKKTEELKIQTESLEKGAMNPDTGEIKEPTDPEKKISQNAQEGREYAETLSEYDKLDQNKPEDKDRMIKLENYAINIIQNRPRGKEFFQKIENGKLVDMADNEKRAVIQTMLKDGAKFRSLANEQLQTVLNDPNRPSTANEQVLASFERYQDAKLRKENADAQSNLVKTGYGEIQNREKEFQDKSTPGTLGNRLKTLSDGEPQRKAKIHEGDANIQLLQQQLTQLNAEHEQLTKIRTNRYGQAVLSDLQDLKALDGRISDVRKNISKEIRAREQQSADQENLERLRKENEELPDKKVQIEEARRNADAEKKKADVAFKEARENFDTADRQRLISETYYAEMVKELPDRIINTYLNEKVDEVGRRVEEAIPFMNEKLRQKLLLGLREKQIIETKLLPFSQMRERLNKEEVKFGWEMLVEGHKVAADGTDVTTEMYVQDLVGKTQWNTLTLEEREASIATCAMEIFNRYKEARGTDFDVKFLREKDIKGADLRKMAKFLWNKPIMEAVMQTNPRFRQEIERRLPGVDLTTPEGEEQAQGEIAKNPGLYAAMMTVSLAASLFKEQPQQQEENG